MEPLKVIVGAGRTRYDGWLATQQAELDLLKPETWEAMFGGRKVDALLAEHVWHLLTPGQARVAARTCYEHLAEGGWMRLAVPDGYHPDPAYIDWVKPNGTGPSAPIHRVLYNYKSLSEELESAGFVVKLLEYFDEGGEFHRVEWDPRDGFVRRSAQHDERNKGGTLRYTSVVVDARKASGPHF